MPFHGLKEFVKKEFGIDQYETISQFTVFHPGWECDEVAVLVRVNGETYAIGTNHGSPLLLTKNDLLAMASSYTEVLQDTLDAATRVS